MALWYRNRVTGRNVEVLEPNELGEKLKTVKRRGKSLDEDRIEIAKRHRKQLIDKMNDSWKWERLDGKPRGGNGGAKKTAASNKGDGGQGDGGQQES